MKDLANTAVKIVSGHMQGTQPRNYRVCPIYCGDLHCQCGERGVRRMAEFHALQERRREYEERRRGR